MKKRVFTIVALTMVLGLLVTGTAAAGGNRTSFTGTTWIVGEIFEGRYWVPGPNFVFWRGTTFILAMDATDNRVDGISCSDHNGNYQLSPDPVGFVEGQMWGKVRIFPPMALTDGQPFDCEQPANWEGSFVGDRAVDGSEHIKFNLKGRGMYEGLQLRYETWSGPTDEIATVSGEVLDPGKK